MPVTEFTPKQPTLTCLECEAQGNEVKLKVLKRHLRQEHDLTPEAYRKKHDLASDYPMVAPGADRKGVKLGPRKKKNAPRATTRDLVRNTMLILRIRVRKYDAKLVSELKRVIKETGVAEVEDALLENPPNPMPV